MTDRKVVADVVRGRGRKRKGSLEKLLGSPEFLFRRAYQIASAVFARACADLDLTPSQYSALFALREMGPIGQNELGRMVYLDRSTAALVVRLLAERGLISIAPSPVDKRKVSLALTDAGRLVLARAERLSGRFTGALFAGFDPKEADRLIELLHQLSRSHLGD